MPTYTCEKCARIFKQKSHYQDHVEKKNDCAETSAIAPLVAEIKEIKKEIKEIKDAHVDLALPESSDARKKAILSYIEDIHTHLWNNTGFATEKALEHLTLFFAYRLIEFQVDTLGLPKECRWSYILSLKNDTDIFETIKKGINAFRKCQPTKPFFKPHEIDKTTILGDIVRLINRIPTWVLQETDIIGDIFEYMLGRGMSTMASEGQYFTMRALCNMAARLAIQIRKGRLRREDGTLCTFADWFCGTGGFPIAYVNAVKQHLKDDVDWTKDSASIYAQDKNVSSAALTLLNMLILTGVPFNTDNIRSGNSFTDPITRGNGAPFPGLTIDYNFMNPPYGGDSGKHGFKYSISSGKGKNKSTEYLVNQDIQTIGINDNTKVSAGVQLGMATTSSDGGVCCIVLPQGFFFGTTSTLVELRQKIAEEYKIHYVVDVASGAFANTGTKTSMLVFQKGVGATDTISFIDMDEKVLIEATLDELRAKNYSLNYKQYLPQSAVEEMDGFEMVKLGDICDIHFGERVTKKENIGSLYPVYGGGNETFKVDKKNREGITCKVSRFGISEHNCVQVIYGEYWLMDSGFTISGKDGRVLDSYLWNWLLQNKSIVYQCGRATAQMNMDIDTFKCIQIPLPSLERQQEIVDAIDGFTKLAHAEEQALKLLEKQVMIEVKEMGKRKERVKLGEVCNWQMGKRIVKDQVETGAIPVYGGGGITFYTNTSNRNGINCKISREGMSESNCVIMIYGEYHQNSQGMTVISKNTTKIINPYIWYWLVINRDKVYECGHGTAQKAISMTMLNDLEIPLPSLAEQQTLQPAFDEIRHKHAKIAEYKAKAQEAIRRLIPGAQSTQKSNTNDSDGKQEAIPSEPESDDEKQDTSSHVCAQPSTSSSPPAYSNMKLDELKALCKERKIKGFSTKKKDELVRMLEESDKQ